MFSHDILGHTTNQNQVIIKVEISSRTTAEINCDNNIIQDIESSHYIDNENSFFSSLRNINYEIVGNELKFNILFDCPNKCYSYKAHLVGDISKRPYYIKEALLFKEIISSIDGKNIKMISNNYVMETTSCHLLSQKIIEIPLIPLDLNSPQDFFTRAHKLLVFS
jgi:hypothetical protein